MPRPRIGRSGLRDIGSGQQVLPDLAERDGQRLLLDPGLDQRPHILKQALAELGVVGVDLPCPLCRHDDQAVLSVDDAEQVVDRRVGDAFRSGNPCHRVPSIRGARIRRGHYCPELVRAQRIAGQTRPTSRLPAGCRRPRRTCSPASRRIRFLRRVPPWRQPACAPPGQVAQCRAG
jgi:hypothetical protein